MAKAAGRRTVGAKKIAQAAKIAASEAVQELESEIQDIEGEDTEILDMGSLEQPDSIDVFEEGHRRAVALNDSVRFSIKKNSELLATKDFPYSWDKVREDYGPGYYQVIAKRRSNGHLLKQQSETLGDPNQGRDEETEVETQSENLSVLALISQQQERADARAREATQKAEGSLASVMQTVVQMQQQSNQQMMTMFMESAKQTQNLMLTMFQSQNKEPKENPLMPLVTALLTKPAPVDQGMNWGEVLKLVQDAETRAENRATKQYELIEKKADQLAEIKAEAMAGNEEHDKPSMFQSLVPILSQVLAQGQGQPPQFSPEQLANARLEEQRRISGAPAALREGFTESHGPPTGGLQAARRAATGTETRPAIGAARPEPRRTMPNPGRPAPQPAKQASPQPPAAQTGAGATVAGPTQVQKSESAQPKTPEVVLDDRTKKAIFDFVGLDIGNAMLQGEKPGTTAEVVLKKLETEGIARHTVATAFKLEDFYGYADQFGLPPEAKGWLKEFHEFIQNQAAPVATSGRELRAEGAHGGAGPQLVRPTGVAPTVVESGGAEAKTVNAGSVNGTAVHGNGTTKSVAPNRSSAAPRRTGKPLRDNPKNI